MPRLPANKPRVPVMHDLKIAPEYFVEVCVGNKNFEIRKNDRDFQVGDFLFLQAWLQNQAEYTGKAVLVEVTYLTDYAQQEGYVVMSTRKVVAT